MRTGIGVTRLIQMNLHKICQCTLEALVQSSLPISVIVQCPEYKGSETWSELIIKMLMKTINSQATDFPHKLTPAPILFQDVNELSFSVSDQN